MTVARTVAQISAALGLVLTALPAPAQYIWLDKNGQKVFSDRAPPLEVPERSILKRPGGALPQPIPPAGLSEAGSPPPNAVPPVGAPRALAQDGELAERKRQAEATEASRRAADEARQAAAKADNCQRAQQSAAALNSGVRMATVNAQGERTFMDDQTRAAEAQRAQSIVASDCR